MLKSCTKKLVVIGNTSTSMTDSKEELKEKSIIWDLEIVKCITWNVKLNKDNEEMSALLDSSNKANFIS